jgi:hypothetical protein
VKIIDERIANIGLKLSVNPKALINWCKNSPLKAPTTAIRPKGKKMLRIPSPYFSARKQTSQSIGSVITATRSPIERQRRRNVKEESSWIRREGTENIETKP